MDEIRLIMNTEKEIDLLLHLQLQEFSLRMNVKKGRDPRPRPHLYEQLE